MSFARLLLLVFALCYQLSTAWAEAPRASATEPVLGDEPAGYRQLVADALAEYEAGHFEESRALMLRAHELYPNARTLRGLGMVSFELRAYPESVEQLEAALGSRLRPLTGELRTETEALLTRARSFVGTLVLQVSPPGAQVLVDGSEQPGGSDKLLAVGEHSVELRAEGFIAERRTVRIVGGEQLRLQLQLLPLTSSLSPPAQEKPRRWYRSPWLWSIAGVVVAGGVATGVGLALRPEEAERATPYRGLSGETPLVGPSQ